MASKKGQGYISLDKFAGYLPKDPADYSLLDKSPLTSDYSFQVDPTPALQKRANSKLLAFQLATALGSLGPVNLAKQYERGVNCSSVVQKTGDRYRSTYCERRFCLVCNRIRTSKLIYGYKPALDNLADLHFLTLTVPNVKPYELKKTIQDMTKTFQRIKDNLRKNYGHRITGIRKIEVTYNDLRKDYHPHFHLILSGQEAAERLLELWLNHYQNATRRAQDIKKADENAVKELFKYFTKITTNNKTSRKLHVNALNTIFNSIQGIRIFQPFGIKKVKPATTEAQREEYVQEAARERQAIANGTINQEPPPEVRAFVWNQYAANWLDVERRPMVEAKIRKANRFFYRRFVYSKDESNLPDYNLTPDLIRDPAPG
jgi:hypothetical protein